MSLRTLNCWVLRSPHAGLTNEALVITRVSAVVFVPLLAVFVKRTNVLVCDTVGPNVALRVPKFSLLNAS